MVILMVYSRAIRSGLQLFLTFVLMASARSVRCIGKPALYESGEACRQETRSGPQTRRAMRQQEALLVMPAGPNEYAVAKVDIVAQ